MRIWDINPGYLNDRSLLGEHRELHGIASIIRHGKKGYSRHPETLRWVEHFDALALRHRQLSCEMMLRGFNEKSPLEVASYDESWPEVYIDAPAEQYELLRRKYAERGSGRIALPRNIQELWSNHKYSMLARDQNRYRTIGRLVAQNSCGFAELAETLVAMLRERPDEGGIRNAVQHMWGHVSGEMTETAGSESWSLDELLRITAQQAIASRERYLLASTALSELSVWPLYELEG